MTGFVVVCGRGGTLDSKAMTMQDRDEVRARLEASELVGTFTRSLSAEELSGKMLRKQSYNLNAISHDTAAALVQEALDYGANVSEMYVDTVGDPEKYAAKLRGQFPVVAKVVVTSKADSKYAIVGAASIVAKTTRDHELKAWRCDDIAPDAQSSYGSGYPGDPTTISWLESAVDPHFGFPSIVRFSWSTAKKLLKTQGAVTVVFEGDSDDEDGVEPGNTDIRTHFKKPRRAETQLSRFYSSRNLSDADGAWF